MSALVKWKIFCNTENNWTDGWLSKTQGSPTVCFNDNSHDIDSTSSKFLDTTEVSIKREDTLTGGNYNCQGYSVEILPWETKIIPVSWPFPVNITSVNIQSNDKHLGDVVNAVVNPKALAGVSTSECILGDNTIFVNSTVLDNAKIGYDLWIEDELVGRIIKVDMLNSSVTLESSLLQGYPIGAYIYMEIRIIREFNLGYRNGNNFGTFNGNKYIPADIVTKIIYKNNHQTFKTFCFSIEYLF